MYQFDRHFSAIAESYREMRSTELAPIRYITKKLKIDDKIIAADIGCGCGRYSLALLKELTRYLTLFCVDRNVEMLKQLKTYLHANNVKNFLAIQSDAESIPLKDQTLNFIITFNAIHHFPVLRFFKEIWRLLRKNGLLFIYTRTRSQNRRNVWGKYFPSFAEKETRLFEIHELKQYIELIPEFTIEEVKLFYFSKKASVDRLVELARNHHYSTFALYSQEEFAYALRKFYYNLKKEYPHANSIKWINENVMFVVRKK
jgi:ubiquinone/menaquinone biosynthesis C-methylase UbiE